MATLEPPIMAWIMDSLRFIPPDKSLLANDLFSTIPISVNISVISLLVMHEGFNYDDVEQRYISEFSKFVEYKLI